MSYPLTTRGPMPAVDWAEQNPILAQFEEGMESDTGKVKRGPGAWNDLPYFNPSGASAGVSNSAPEGKVPKSDASGDLAEGSLDDSEAEYLKVIGKNVVIEQQYLYVETGSGAGQIWSGDPDTPATLKLMLAVTAQGVLIFGDDGITGRKMAGLPTSDPGEQGMLWNDGGTLKISAGS